MKLRVARHTNNLKAIVTFYTSVLGFEVTGTFEDHNNYDGVFLKLGSQDWHLEFTTTKISATHHFDEDDLLVLYPETLAEYIAIEKRINALDIQLEQAKNPYWQENGIMIKDPDGFRIIISNQTIT